MSWLDDLTGSIFGTESAPAPQPSPMIPQVEAVPAVSLYSPDAPLSNQYRLKDLTVTNQNLSSPNLPSESYQFDNLVTTAQGIEYIESVIGPIRILSGFRTKELQNALAASGEPTSFGLSFHETGRAIDFVPTTMSLEEYFGRMLANDDVKSMFAEIAYKPGQGSIHAAFNVPGDVRTTKILGLNQDNVYAKLSVDDIARFIAPYMASAQDAYDYAASKLVTLNRTPLILSMVAAAGGIFYLVATSGRHTRKNPTITSSKKDEIVREIKKLRRIHPKWTAKDAVAYLHNRTSRYTAEWTVLDAMYERLKKNG